jgi:hypothetical protein
LEIYFKIKKAFEAVLDPTQLNSPARQGIGPANSACSFIVCSRQGVQTVK